MKFDPHQVFRLVHIALGFAAFFFGAGAILLPKFSAKSSWHRWIGRSYAVAMLGSTAISIPLAIAEGSIFLLVIGLLTFVWVVGGWIALRRLRAQVIGKRISPSSRLRLHITLMGSSYIAAWTAFLVNVRPLGGGVVWMIMYAIAPSIIGSYLIARATARLSNLSRTRTVKLGSRS